MYESHNNESNAWFVSYEYNFIERLIKWYLQSFKYKINRHRKSAFSLSSFCPLFERMDLIKLLLELLTCRLKKRQQMSKKHIWKIIQDKAVIKSRKNKMFPKMHLHLIIWRSYVKFLDLFPLTLSKQFSIIYLDETWI